MKTGKIPHYTKLKNYTEVYYLHFQNFLGYDENVFVVRPFTIKLDHGELDGREVGSDIMYYDEASAQEQADKLNKILEGEN